MSADLPWVAVCLFAMAIPWVRIGSMSIFRWDTIKELGPHDLFFRSPVQGMECEIELTSGTKILVWRADDGQQYFCHGLTFGGVQAPGGAISPFSGWSVEAILRNHYEATAEAEAKPGDIVVWKGAAPNTTPHSAILKEPAFASGQASLHETTRLRSKNGIKPDTNLALDRLLDEYGDSFIVHRLR
jgi:hypothetical protein